MYLVVTAANVARIVDDETAIADFVTRSGNGYRADYHPDAPRLGKIPEPQQDRVFVLWR